MLWLPLSVVLATLILPQVWSFTILVEEKEINATAGENITLSVRPSAAVGRGIWWFGNPPVVYWRRGLYTLSPDYSHRAVLLFPNTSLLLKAVRAADTGQYTVRMVSLSGKISSTAIVTLNVLEASQAEGLRCASVLMAAALVSTLIVEILSGYV